MAEVKSKISPMLWFDDQAEKAANFYVSIFENSKILDVSRYGEAGPGEAGTAMTVVFTLDGFRITALNGGPLFTFNESVSFVIDCQDQKEVDYFWEKLTEGGAESQCGWLKDRFGLSWQVVPSVLVDLLGQPDHDKAQRAMKAMLQMKKIDISVLQNA